MEEIEPGAAVMPYAPMSLVQLAAYLVDPAYSDDRWRLVAEFLEEYRWEDPVDRHRLVGAEPPTTGEERWDVFLAALAEHLTSHDGHGAPDWAGTRSLAQFWFPFNTPAARVDAFVHAPASFRRRGIFVAARDLEVA